MTHTFRALLLALAYCIAVACAAAQAAHAGTYAVSSCHFRDGRPASVSEWRVFQQQDGAQYDLSCTDGSGIGVSAVGNRIYPHGYLTGVELRVPPDLQVSTIASRANLWTSGTLAWTWDSGYWGDLVGTGLVTISVCGGTGCGGELFDWRLIMRDHDLQSVVLGVSCSVYRVIAPAVRSPRCVVRHRTDRGRQLPTAVWRSTVRLTS